MSTPPYSPESIRKSAQLKKEQNKKLVDKLKRKPPAGLDEIMQDLHEETFQEVDCLTCANCCKTTSPIVTDRDIDRLAQRLRIKPSQLIDQYLKIDEDNDYVFRAAPCPFLDTDNHCRVYDDRPTACRTYPHTNRKKFYQLLDLTYQNTFICPAVQQIFQKLNQQINS